MAVLNYQWHRVQCFSKSSRGSAGHRMVGTAVVQNNVEIPPDDIVCPA